MEADQISIAAQAGAEARISMKTVNDQTRNRFLKDEPP